MPIKSQKIIIANWKMNPNSAAKAARFFKSLGKLPAKNKKNIIICPPFLYIPIVNSLRKNNFEIGAQDCFWENKGSFTGQISAEMLRDMKVKYVICGHSEKRKLGETNIEINKKIKSILSANMTPILCVGENFRAKAKAQIFSTIEKQIKQGLKGVNRSLIKNLIIAYEPIWAIGNKNPCSLERVTVVALFVRKLMGKLFGKQIAKKLKIIYGGSVDLKNADMYIGSDFISGLLIGSASLNIPEFIKITEKI